MDNCVTYSLFHRSYTDRELQNKCNISYAVLYIYAGFYNSYTTIIEVKAKKWGNSISIVIPNETIEKSNIKPEANIVYALVKIADAIRDLPNI